jgi:hypothetical protein
MEDFPSSNLHFSRGKLLNIHTLPRAIHTETASALARFVPKWRRRPANSEPQAAGFGRLVTEADDSC